MMHTKSPFFEVLSAKSDQDSELFMNGNSQRNSLYADQTNLTVNQKLSLSLSRISSSHNLSYNICDNSFSIIHDFTDIKDKEKAMSLQINLQSTVLTDSDVEHIVSKLNEYNDNILSACVNLHNSLIGDNGLKAISDSLTKFQSLTKLHMNLQNNNITDQGLCYLWQAINKLKNLKDLELDLSYNEIQGSLTPDANGIEAYAQILKCCFISAAPQVNEILFAPELVKLSLNFEANHFTHKGIKNMIESLNVSKNLIDLHLNFRKNNLDCTSLIDLSESLGRKQVSTLYLDIGNNKVTCDDANIILYNISYNIYLENLTVDLQGSIRKECKSSGKVIDAQRSSHVFNNISSIDLRLGWNNLNAENLVELLLKFQFCDKLVRISLDLQYNCLSDKGILQLFEKISPCRMLRYLNLNLKKNSMNDKSLIQIGSTVTTFKKLKTLYLNCEFSNLTLTALEQFNLDVQLCINIKHLSLNLQQSNITNENFEKIAKKMQRCHSSVELRVAFNIRIEKPKGIEFRNSLSRVNSNNSPIKMN